MSTKATIKWREQTAELPGFHLYDDVLDEFAGKEDREPPVYLRLDGVEVSLQTLSGGGASLTVSLPRSTARELGLLPTVGDSSAPSASNVGKHK